MNHTKEANRFILIIMTVIDVILLGGYIQDGMQGNITMTFAGIFAALVAATMDAAVEMGNSNIEKTQETARIMEELLRTARELEKYK